jgi:hypothetical protein
MGHRDELQIEAAPTATDEVHALIALSGTLPVQDDKILDGGEC